MKAFLCNAINGNPFSLTNRKPFICNERYIDTTNVENKCFPLSYILYKPNESGTVIWKFMKLYSSLLHRLSHTKSFFSCPHTKDLLVLNDHICAKYAFGFVNICIFADLYISTSIFTKL